MSVPITVPEVGESITEGVLVEWKKNDGDWVDMDEELFELETDKVTMTVQAEAAGVLKIKVEADSDVEVGQEVGEIDTDADKADAGGDDAQSEIKDSEPEAEEQKEEEEKESEVQTSKEREEARETARAEETEDTEAPSAEEYDLDKVAPAARPLIVEHNLNPDEIEATGRNDVILKQDVVRYLKLKDQETDVKQTPSEEDRRQAAKREEPKTAKAKKEAPKEEKASPPPPAQEERKPGERQTRKRMSQLRQRIAGRLVESQQNTATLTTFNEIDMTNLMALRAKWKEPFAEKHGIKLGVMSFFVKAAVDALQRVPAVNSMIEGEELVQNNYYDIGVAVSTERGLIVPNIRDADRLSFAEIELTIADLAKRAREKKIGLEELQGGSFTISNGGVFGSLLSTPILNPPQSGILGMHGIKKRPVVVDDNDTVEVRPMMYVALSYDHRVIDGAESVTFLKRIVECIESPERLMLDV
ncbi:2-oxoglutarate dehydrogenase complex dihydrolipoyllysine-residue succinyltransferase [bacterium]|nr:2-oxoglutarate dehydrogenase complex dihydrolipoyllysine-residue succinyltransferase [bacterium]